MTTPAPELWPEIQALLHASGLPTSDLDETALGRFVVETDGDRLLGCVAVEPYGDAGLLRSLAVADDARGRGLGGRLVAAAEAHARDQGIGALYLLTTTAEPFFRARGYVAVDRDAVPAAVRASAEFCDVCPASAACLGKRLRPA